jgi:hypothetical protein
MILEKAFMKKQLTSALLFFGAAVMTAVGLHFTVGLLHPQEKGQAEFSSFTVDETDGRSLRAPAFKHGEPVNGGKPHANIGMSGVFRRISDEAFEFAYEVLPDEPCDEFIVHVRGVDGVRLEQDQVTSQSCSTKLSESIVVQVPEGEAGYVVLSIELHGGEGDLRGMSRSFLVANGATAPRQVENLGHLEKSGAKTIRVMKAE